jgi:hypothetical protein
MININNKCLVAFGEIAQNLINFRFQKENNSTKTPYWGLDKETPLFAIDSRSIVGARDTQTTISLGETGTGGKDLQSIPKSQLDEATNKIIGTSKFNSFDSYYILIGLAGGTQIYAYNLAKKLKIEGKKVIFLVVGLTPFDNNREANETFGKSKLSEFSHTYLDTSKIDFESEELPFEVQYMDLVQAKLQDFWTLFSQASLDLADATNAVCKSNKAFTVENICLNGTAFEQAGQVAKLIKAWHKKQPQSIASMAWCIMGNNARLTSLKLNSEISGLLADDAYATTKAGQGKLQECIIFCSL